MDDPSDAPLERNSRPDDETSLIDSTKDLAERLDRLWSDGPESKLSRYSAQGRVVAHYRIQDVLGSGGFGVVYLAEDLDSGGWAALKLPRPEVLLDPEKRKRFSSEATLASQLRHPGIVRVFETDLVSATPYIASEWCDGPNLGEWLAEWTAQSLGLPSWKSVAALVAEIADAIQYAHEQGISHRDLKPANILLTRREDDSSSGEDGLHLSCYKAQVADFGLAKMASSTWADTRSSLLVGTPLYMSPEQMSRQPSSVPRSIAASDIYSLGVILFELLTGHSPIRGETYFELLDNVQHQPRRRLNQFRSDTPKAMEAICSRCLEKNPEGRYSNMGALASDLRNCFQGKPLAPMRRRLLARFRHWCSRPKRMVSAGWFALWGQVLLGVWMLLATSFMSSYGVASARESSGMLVQAAIVSLFLNLPTGWAGWKTLQGSRLAAWIGAFLGTFNLAVVLWGMLVSPILFQDLYTGHNSFFSLNTHMMLTIVLGAQAFLFWCAVMSAEATKRAISQ